MHKFFTVVWDAVALLTLIYSCIWTYRALTMRVSKFPSRHKWYTLSGLVSRPVSFFAARWAESPNDLFPVAVFVYGMVELFGLRRSIQLLLRFHAKQNAKVRKHAGHNGPGVSAHNF